MPRADGDREALRILLVARQETTEAASGEASRLRALLLAAGGSTGIGLAHGQAAFPEMQAIDGSEPR